MDVIAWPEMFLAFIFANNLAETTIAGKHCFMPHGFNDCNVPAYRNMTFGRFGTIRKLHMFGPETEMDPPSQRNMTAGKPDGHTSISLETSLPTDVADHAGGKIHRW